MSLKVGAEGVQHDLTAVKLKAHAGWQRELVSSYQAVTSIHTPLGHMEMQSSGACSLPHILMQAPLDESQWHCTAWQRAQKEHLATEFSERARSKFGSAVHQVEMNSGAGGGP